MTPPDRRALSRDLTRLANAGIAEAIALDERPGGTCPLIGITGPPGVGKSTLIAKLAQSRVTDAGLAILAIDPSSPLTGGAILGDRIRMAELTDDLRIFVRSLATRGSTDGLTHNLPLLIRRLADAGFGEIVLETVGVGQVEYAVRAMVDTMVLVLSPGTGDQIQAMKSGIIEVPDIFAINKADQPGADRIAQDIGAILHHRGTPADGWRPRIVKLAAERGEGIDGLSTAIDRHRDWLAAHPAIDRDRAWRAEIARGLIARLADTVLRSGGDASLREALARVGGALSAAAE